MKHLGLFLTAVLLYTLWTDPYDQADYWNKRIPSPMPPGIEDCWPDDPTGFFRWQKRRPEFWDTSGSECKDQLLPAKAGCL